MTILNTAIRQGVPFHRKDEHLTIPNDGGRYWQIKADQDVLSSGKPRQFEEANKPKYPYPAVANKTWGIVTKYAGREYDYIEVTDEWQWFFYHFWNWASNYRLPKGRVEGTYTKPQNFRTFLNVTPGTKLWVYTNLTEAHRSHTDSDSREAGSRCVVTQTNLANPKPYKWLARPCTRAILKEKQDLGSEIEVYALDMLKPPPDPSRLALHEYYWMNEQTTILLPNKRYKISNYPQIEEANEIHGLPLVGTPAPLVTWGGSFRIRKSACTLMKPGQAWTPYE